MEIVLLLLVGLLLGAALIPPRARDVDRLSRWLGPTMEERRKGRRRSSLPPEA